MRAKLLSLVVMGLAMMNSACSVSTVGSDEISAQNVHQQYGASYTEGDNKTYTDAQFRVKNSFGDTVELLYPSYVLVNNAPMNHHSFLGARYEREFPGLVQNVEFKYVDMEGKAWINRATLYPVSLKTYNNTLDLGSSFRVTVEAANMRSGETNEASLCQIQEGGSVCAYGNSSGSTITISSWETSGLKPGLETTLTVERTYATGVESAKGGSINLRARTRTVYIQVR